MEQRYLGQEHKEYSEKCQQEVAEMQRHPLTYEQFLQQIERNRRFPDCQKINNIK